MTHYLHIPWWRQPLTIGVLAVVISGAGGLIIGSQAAQPEPVTEVRTVTEAPKACVTALAAADEITDLAQDYVDEMIRLEGVDGGLHDHLQGRGPHWQITHDHEAALKAATEQYASDKIACLESGRG